MAEKKERKKRSQGAINKTKGSNAERFYVKKFVAAGFEHCITSRLGSKIHDYAGIDLLFLPFNTQVKAGKQVALNASRELQYIFDRIRQLFPPTSEEYKLPNILIHKKEVGSGSPRTIFDEIVTMTFADFLKFIEKIKPSSTGFNLPNMVIHRKILRKGKTETTYDKLVIMPFDDFLVLINNIEEW